MLLFLSKRKPCSVTLRRCFSSSPQNPNFTVADCLISSFGFSTDKAAKLSKPISHLKSSQNLDSVRRFLLQQVGFSSDTDIRKLVTLRPRILCSSLDKTLAPNLTALRDIGLSTIALTQLILSNPSAIMYRSAASKIKFWLDFFGGDETAFLKSIHHANGLLTNAITGVLIPNISVLRNHGLSSTDIHRIVIRTPRIVTSRVGLLDDMVSRAKELGFQPGSAKFVEGLHAMHYNSREVLEKKMELLRKFKWSDDEFLNALRRAPMWTTLSERNLEDKMDFFVREAMCDPSYIASHPILLAYNLERRLRPRISVLRLLESKGYCEAKKGLYAKIWLSNKKFVETYVSPNMEEIPELIEAYHGACA